jgi:hypothetical protein
MSPNTQVKSKVQRIVVPSANVRAPCAGAVVLACRQEASPCPLLLVHLGRRVRHRQAVEGASAGAAGVVAEAQRLLSVGEGG